MAVSIVFSDNPAVNKKINRIIALMTIIGFIGAGSVWSYTYIYPLFSNIATVNEVVEIDTKSMQLHNAGLQTAGWANKNDVNHIANLVVDSQLQTIQDDIDWYEDEATRRELTVKEAKLLGRLETRKEQLERSFIIEPNTLHTHGSKD